MEPSTESITVMSPSDSFDSLLWFEVTHDIPPHIPFSKRVSLPVPTSQSRGHHLIRQIALYRVEEDGTIYAIDANCYHAGGSLTGHGSLTDVEEIGGELCVKCPIHHYRISITTGRRFFQPVTFEKSSEGKLVPVVQPWRNNGVQYQRIHQIKRVPIKDSISNKEDVRYYIGIENPDRSDFECVDSDVFAYSNRESTSVYTAVNSR